MIQCVTYENLHRYGKAFHAQFRLRHTCFIERQNYNVSKYNGMEFDQYDTPAAVYLVYQAPNGAAWGCARLTPISQGSMVQDLWPELVQKPEEVFVSGVWESTRFCIDRTLSPDMRRHICNELVVGYFEAGFVLGIEKIVGVMQPLIFRRVFGDTGCRYGFLGPRLKISDGGTIAAAAMEVTEAALRDVRIKTGVDHAVLAEHVEDEGLELQVA